MSTRVSPISLRPRGFTLIELLISVAVFTIVMVIALGSLLSLAEANRKAELLSAATSNFNSSIDSMSRAIRTGSVYHCGGGALTTMMPCSGGSTQFAFFSATGQTTVYALNTTSCQNGIGCIVRSTDGGATYLPITSPDIVITSLQFFVRGSAGTIQPQVFMLISGYITLKGSQQTPFNVQTSITQRLYGQ